MLWPAAFLGFSLAIPLIVGPFKRWLAKYVWMSFQAGFGQTAGSVVTGIGLLLGAGLFIWRQVGHAELTVGGPPHPKQDLEPDAGQAEAVELAAQGVLEPRRRLEEQPDGCQPIVVEGIAHGLHDTRK